MLLVRQLRQVWNQLSRQQRLGLGAGVGLVLLVTVLTSGWAMRTRYEVLFADLDPAEAARIVDELRSKDHPYRLESGGRAVLVPRDLVYELRLELATLGLPSRGSIGYEIFDKNMLGMTDFVQRLNYQRALEGELVRTIEQLAEIDVARVHVVVPEPSLFIEEEQRPTASVLLRVHAGRTLQERQVQGIRCLVAAGVEGLDPDDVTVVDAHGKLLGRHFDDEDGALSSQRMELVRTVEGYLADKARSLLEGVLGAGKALVQVNAVLDFERVERTIESYDGEKSVVRSEERTSRSAGDTDSGESVITNYEIPRTVERVIGAPANIKQLSVAVLVDGVYGEEDAAGKRPYNPRPEAELTQLAGIVENAIGIDGGRGDRVSIECFPFDRRAIDEEHDLMERQQRMRMLLELANKLGVGLVVVLLVVLARNFLRETRKLVSPDPSSAEQAELAGLPPGELRLLEMQTQLQVLIRENPQRFAHLMRSWLRESGT